VDPCSDASIVLPNRERVVEVLRGLGIDGEGEEVAQIDAIRQVRRGRRVRLELRARARVHEQAFQHGEDVLRLTEDTFYVRPAAARNGGDDEVAGAGVTETLAVEHERYARDEEGLADDELAALRDLDDDAFYTWRKRRIVTAEPAAPRRRPVASRISALR
jgi:hypothetical protein